MTANSQDSNLLTDLALAWGLLTSLPLPFLPKDAKASLGRSAAFYPLVGLVLGGILAGAGWLLYQFLPPGLAAAILLALWVALTGMLHLDGFMDSCDGLLPPRHRERRLEIMKDSRVGAFGVVAVVLLLLVKFSALAALPAGYRLVTLVTVPVLARWAMTWAMARYPPARTEGLAEFFRRGLGWPQLGLASALALMVALGLLGLAGFVFVVITWLTTIVVAGLARGRLGGLTGDVYGTICETTEAVLLVAAVALKAV